MARSITVIYDSIISEKESTAALTGLVPVPDDAQTFLSDLTSASKVAMWRLQAFTIAVAINVLENIFDLHQVAVENLADVLITGTTRWYQEETKRFQFGDTLTWNGVKFVYSPIVVANQIIDFSAVQEGSGRVTIKVAKAAAGTGDPEKLSAPEETAFNGYIEQIKFAGTNIAIITDDPDDLSVTYRVTVNPLVIDPVTGSLVDSPAVFPVEDAINNHVKNLPFDGVLVLSELTDSVQAVTGVIDPKLDLAQSKFGALPYSTIDKTYNPNAGHMVLDEVASTITYNI